VTWNRITSWYPIYQAPITYYYRIADNNVYLGDEIVGTTSEVYQQAQDLANLGQSSDDVEVIPEPSDQWLPLGVFAVIANLGDEPEIMVQLALDRSGNIAGSYFNAPAGVVLPIVGSVQQETQRAAWKIGKEDQIIMQTGIDNLSKDSSSVLIFFPDGTSETWTLQRQSEEKAKDFIDKIEPPVEVENVEEAKP